jgi:hypothetical protein
VSGRALTVLAVLAADLVAVGCGGGGGGTTGTGGGTGNATCESNASCGGNIVGTWAVTQVCDLTTSVPPGGCADATNIVSDQVQTGTIAFRSDGTATQMFTTTGTLTKSSPPICLTSAMQTCADMDAAARALVGSTYTAASCADSAGTCVCTLMFASPANVSGTYTTSGSTLTVVSSADTTTGTFCVAGANLIIELPGATGKPPVVYVFTRQ